MNLINFHKFGKNDKYVKENNIYYNSQGIVNSYFVMLIGNGHNRYIFKTIYKNNIHMIVIDEKHNPIWEIGTYVGDNGEDNYRESLEFYGVGKIDGCNEYVTFRNGDYDDFTHLYAEEDSFEILDIAIDNDHLTEPMICVYDEINYCKVIQKPRYESIKKLVNFEPNTDLQKIEYSELFDKSNWNKELYIIIQDGITIPFKIRNITHADITDSDTDDIMEAEMKYKFDVIYVKDARLYYEPTIDDGYEVSIYIKDFAGQEFNEYCYFAK